MVDTAPTPAPMVREAAPERIAPKPAKAAPKAEPKKPTAAELREREERAAAKEAERIDDLERQSRLSYGAKSQFDA